ncbi:MAG: urease beta subunit [Halopseudomonas sp.]|jgi:urease beta subunit
MIFARAYPVITFDTQGALSMRYDIASFSAVRQII